MQQTSQTELLTPAEAAEALRTPVRTLERWRMSGGGPRYVKLGRRVLYARRAIDAFVEGCERAHTAARGRA